MSAAGRLPGVFGVCASGPVSRQVEISTIWGFVILGAVVVESRQTPEDDPEKRLRTR